MPAHDHLTPQGEHKPALDRAVPETDEQGRAVVHMRTGTFFAGVSPVAADRVSVGLAAEGKLVQLLVDERQLRTCIAALTSVLGQLVPDHPGNEKEA